MSETPVWGIDLTESSLRAAKLVMQNGRPFLEAWEVIDFAADVPDPHGTIRFETVHRALHRFAATHDLDACTVAVTARSETLFVQTAFVPQSPNLELPALLRAEAAEQIPGGIADVFWDYRVERVASTGDVVAEFFAWPKSVVDRCVKSARAAMIPVDRVEPSALALLNVAVAEGLAAEGVLLVDVDYSSTTAVVRLGDRHVVRSLPIGGCDVAALLRGAGMKPRAAADLAAGGAPPTKDAAELLERVRETVGNAIVDEIRRMVHGTPPESIVRVVLHRSHPTVPDLAATLAAEFGTPVDEPIGFRSIDVNPDVVSAGIQEWHGGLARAVGAALPSLGRAAVAPRLSPDGIPRPESRVPLGFVLAGLFLVVGVLAVWREREAAADASRAAVAAMRSELDGIGDRTVDRAMARLSVRPEDALVRRWKTPDDAFGPAEAFASIVDGLANPPGGRPSGDLAPLLFGFDVGVAAGLRPGRGRVVLALVATDSDAALDAALDRTARSLHGKPGIATLTPVESWTSGAVSDRPGAGGDSSDLRVRFRVRRFDLVLEGSAE